MGDGSMICMHLIPLNYTFKNGKMVNFNRSILLQLKNYKKNVCLTDITVIVDHSLEPNKYYC